MSSIGNDYNPSVVSGKVAYGYGNYVDEDWALAHKLEREEEELAKQFERDLALAREFAERETPQYEVKYNPNDRAIAESLANEYLIADQFGAVVYDADEIHVNEYGTLLFKCPHCGDRCSVNQNEINCTIFTHAVTENGQVNPHINAESALALKNSGAVINGCALQYTLVTLREGVYKAEICSGR
jgi:hypothetical protein